MATLPVYNTAGQAAGQIELADDVFGLEAHPALVHQAVVATLANRRQGTADTKTRGEVHHSTRKLYRQKGTGRARQGMKSAPHWKGGGIVFGPHPRDYSVSLPKKMRRKALLSALSSRIAEDAVIIVDRFMFTAPKTREAAAVLTASHILDKKVLVVLDEITDNVGLSFRNLPNVAMTTIASLGTYEVLLADRLLFTRQSIEALQALKQQPLGIARWIANQGGVA